VAAFAVFAPKARPEHRSSVGVNGLIVNALDEPGAVAAAILAAKQLGVAAGEVEAAMRPRTSPMGAPESNWSVLKISDFDLTVAPIAVEGDLLIGGNTLRGV